MVATFNPELNRHNWTRSGIVAVDVRLHGPIAYSTDSVSSASPSDLPRTSRISVQDNHGATCGPSLVHMVRMSTRLNHPRSWYWNFGELRFYEDAPVRSFQQSNGVFQAYKLAAMFMRQFARIPSRDEWIRKAYSCRQQSHAQFRFRNAIVYPAETAQTPRNPNLAAIHGRILNDRGRRTATEIVRPRKFKVARMA